jgi:putative DNA primase/helicase
VLVMIVDEEDDEFVRRGDLNDRAVFLNLPPIAPSSRRREAEFWAAFHQDYPRILGGLLDAVVGGLHALPSVRLTESPRMADFAAFAEAVGRKLGWPAETALSDYNDNRREAALTKLEDSPIGTFLLENPDYANDWTGTPADLLARLTAFAGKRVAAAARWPKSPQWLSIELRRIAPQLRIHGICVGFERTSDIRLITLSRPNRPPEMAPDVSVTGTETCFASALNGEKMAPDVTPIPESH